MVVIVPIDFSPQSINAAAFTANMLTGVYGAELVFYHMYQSDNRESFAQHNLQKIKDRLLESSIVKMRYVAEKGTKFTESLTHLLIREDATLVVMTVSDRVKIFEDSYSLQIMAQSSCPVLVIPYGHLYSDVRKVALATDFKEIDKTIPLAKVKNVLTIFHPQLHIVHVNPETDVTLNEEMQQQCKKLEEMFQEFRPQFHFIETGRFTDGLEKFIEEENIDLVLTFPRRHSYFSSLIKGTNTKTLVYKNAVPVLTAHE